MTPPINIDGTNENYSNVTIDGQDVEQITIDGQDVLSTIPDSVDDFEHNDLSTVYPNRLSASEFSIQNTTIINDSYTLEFSGGSKGTIRGDESTGLITNPVRGERFSASLRFENTQDYVVAVAFGLQGDTTGYTAGFYPNTQEIFVSTIGGLDNNSIPDVTSAGNFSTSTVYNLTIDYGATTSSDVTVTATDDSGADISATLSDTQYNSGEAGWHKNAFSGGQTMSAFADDVQ